MGFFLLALLGSAASAVVSAWGLMLLVGIAHLDWWPVIPTMSFNTSLTIAAVSVGVLFIKLLIDKSVEAAVE